jgi:hypothetical protein
VSETERVREGVGGRERGREERESSRAIEKVRKRKTEYEHI